MNRKWVPQLGGYRNTDINVDLLGRTVAFRCKALKAYGRGRQQRVKPKGGSLKLENKSPKKQTRMQNLIIRKKGQTGKKG